MIDFNSIVANRQSMNLFLPETVLAGVSFVVLLLGAFAPKAKTMSAFLGLMALIAYVILSLPVASLEPTALFSGAIRFDSFTFFFKVFFAFVGIATLIFILKSKEFADAPIPEVVAFLLALTLSLTMMAASNDLLMMYLSLEMVSILSYVMVGLKRHSRRSSEAGLKYILYGAFASGVMIFGLSYLFGITGTTNLNEIAAYFAVYQGISLGPVLLFALLCTMMGFGFKIATFPTQMWCPDVYEGATLPVTAFLSVGPKAAGFAMTIRFFVTAFEIKGGLAVAQVFQFINWSLVLAVIAAITMTLGNLAAMPQRNLKRLMAYSSIAHAGYLLMGFSTLNQDGVQAVLFYLVAYLLMNFGAFLMILVVSEKLGTEEIEGYRGLGWRSPIIGVTLTVFLFSLTGLPPFAGFIGKVFLFGAVIKQGNYWLAIIAALNTVVSLFYYARIIRAMYLQSPLDETPVVVPRYASAYAVILAVPTLVLGLYWEPLLKFAEQSAFALFG